MHRTLRRTSWPALLALALSFFGCAPSWLTVVIPDFSSNQIQGVWIWRLSPATNQYQRDTLVQFQGVTLLAAGPTLAYATYSSQGALTLTTGLVQNPVHGDTVQLTLGFERGAPGVFRVSTFNAVGESPLSSQSASL
jgi:hypothetical protein